MAVKAPQGGIRREQFVILVSGLQTTPNDLEIRVYKDHQASPDAALSAEAMANLAEVETGVYRYSYSVAGIACGTHLLDEIRVQVLPEDPMTVWQMLDCLVEGVLDATVALPSTSSLTLRLQGNSC